MAIIRFGNTWWGRKWLGALDAIDNSNRLPRGERYARNSSVLSIDIFGSSITARVQGSRPVPYKVSMAMKPFTSAEQRKIEEIVASNPYYLSQLESRSLPQELHDDLLAEKITLFPTSFRDLSMRCSCPDSAVPCKHLAAVVYLLANEIDKNPFLVFSFRGMDLSASFTKGRRNDSEGPIPDLDSMVIAETDPYRYDGERLSEIDFSVIPDLAEPTLRLLTEKPLFYPRGNFKSVLAKMYREAARRIDFEMEHLEIVESEFTRVFTTARFIIKKGSLSVSGRLSGPEETLSFSSENASFLHLAGFLRGLSAGDLSVYPPILAFLVMVHTFAMTIVRRGAFIPDIVKLGEETYGIRWIPSVFNGETASIFRTLVESLPGRLVTYGAAPIGKQEQVLFLVSLFISRIIREAAPAENGPRDRIMALFFRGVPYTVTRFEQKENARTIHLWLSLFFIRPPVCVPVLTVDERDGESFLFSIKVLDSADPRSVPVSMKEFLSGGHPERFTLLRNLALLSTHLPLVNRFLQKEKPITVPAEEFLASWFDALPVLRTLNVRTAVPSSLKELFRPNLTLALKPRSKTVKPIQSYLTLEETLLFSWTAAVGGEFISPKEFGALRKRYGRLIRFKDKYFVLDEKDLARLTDTAAAGPELSSIEMLRIQLEGEYGDTPVQTDPSIRKILERLYTPAPVEIPSGLSGTLRPYQEKGFQWLWHNYRVGFGSLIADDMGLGKTIQVIAFLLKLKEEGLLSDGEGKRALVIAPASVITNWQRELGKFAPGLRASVYPESKRYTEIVITTFAQARISRKKLRESRWLCVAVDEAQNIKNPEAAQTRAVKGIPSAVRIAMTGTPVENRLMDYWSVMDFTMKDLLGNRRAFKRRFAVPIEILKDRECAERFRRLTAPFIIRRLKTDKSIIRDLPDKMKIDHPARLTIEQAALYQGLVDMVDDMLDDMDEFRRKGIVLKLMTGLKEICDHPWLYTKESGAGADVESRAVEVRQRAAGPDPSSVPRTAHDAPLDAARAIGLSGKGTLLVDLLGKILDRREKALIFTQYRQMGDLLVPWLKAVFGQAPLFLHGGLSRKKRDECVDLFQNDPAYPFMILSLKAGGTGLNLTAANNVIHYDLWWNPAVEEQATDRAFRIGQRRDVTVHRLITARTFEEKINELITAKRDLADLTVSTGEHWITELSNAELKDLIKLER